jgi:predicted transcriptional regulator
MAVRQRLPQLLPTVCKDGSCMVTRVMYECLFNWIVRPKVVKLMVHSKEH